MSENEISHPTKIAVIGELDQMIGFMKKAKCTAVVYTSCMNKRFTTRGDDMAAA